MAQVIEGNIQAGQDIVISQLEHHSNIVPWQLLAQRTGANIKAIDIDENGDLDLASAASLITDNTALLAITHISNGLGSVNPVAGLVQQAKQVGALTLVDGARGARTQVFKRSFHALRTICYLIADVDGEGFEGGVQ